MSSAGRAVTDLVARSPVARSPEAAPAWRADEVPTAAAAPWSWPLPGQRVAAEFDPPRVRWGAGHRGIDIVGAVGDPVTSVDDGVVSFSGVIAGVGIVSVQHADGLRSTYQPVDHPLPHGSVVGRGERIGTLAPGGHCLLVNCLHLGALRGRDHYVDPLPLLRGWRLALLPP